MKCFLNIVLFTILCINASAQPYKSIFADGNKQTLWVFQWWNLGGGVLDTVYIDKDTTINGLQYKKILCSGLQETGNAGFLREDTNTGQVWYRSLDGIYCDTAECLAFNFSLQPGDTFDIGNNNIDHLPYPDSLKIVDSVKIINGLRHIYFRAQYKLYKEPITFIEGVGANSGILFKQIDGGLLDPYLLCSYKGTQKTGYVNRLFNGNCYFGNNINAIHKLSDKVVLYPQPARNVVYVKNDSKRHIIQYTIFNSTGIKYKKSSLSPGHAIDLKNIPSGVYLLKIDYADGATYARSFLVNK